MNKTKKRYNSSMDGFIHPFLIICSLFVLVAFATAAAYVHNKNSQPYVLKRDPIPTISKGNIEDTFSKNGKTFPNLSSDYNLIYQHTSPSKAEEAEFLSSKTEQQITKDMLDVCKAHGFTIQARGATEKNTVECIDNGNTWLFVVDNLSNLFQQPWYKNATKSNQAAVYWLHIESAGAPIYH